MPEIESNIKYKSLLKIRIEPDSPEMRSQSTLKACVVEGRRFTFGRRGSRRYVSPEAQLPDHRIANEYPYTISREHCELERREGAVIVRDLNSRLGTVVDGRRICCRKGRESEVSLGVGEYSLVLGRRDGVVRFRLIISES